MTTGGTIPTSKTQSVSFYNTTGVIEKDKNIYYAPRFSKGQVVIGTEVRTAYLNRFNGICPPSSAYTDISVSGWSPQDKTLVVKGNIDDFRLVTEEGACLNYFIVTRSVTKGTGQSAVTKNYYYGFFITGVEQYGGASVRLTIAPDDFSNVFYLHNTHQLTYAEIQGDYEPFNERMKNCYVQRQHYDRVVNYSYDYLDIAIVLEDPRTLERGTFQVGEWITFDFEDGNDTRVSGEILEVDDSLSETTGVIQFRVKSPEKEIGEPQNYSQIQYMGDVYVFDYATEELSWHTVEDIQPTNQQIFLNQEESFRFKYQYRDDRRPFSFSNVFSKREMNTIKNTSAFSSLSTLLKKKIIRACIQYLVVEFKSNEKFCKTYGVITGQSTPVTSHKRYYANLIEGFNKFSPNCFSPLLNIPEPFQKYASAINAYKFYAKLRHGHSTAVNELTSASTVYEYLNENSLADFVYSAYVVNDIGLPLSFTSIDVTNSKITFTVNPEITSNALDKDLYLVPVDTNGEHTSSQFDISVMYKYANQTDYNNLEADEWYLYWGGGIQGVFTMLMLSGYNSRTFTLSFDNDDVSNIKNRYYDPVLEAEPYSFYSLSYLSYEIPFNKNRYYETMGVNVEFYCSLNGAIKLYFVPEYTVESKSFKYYNESLIFTLPSNMPLLSDSYATYYYQNQAQMKNQFAVNDYNRGVDLAQHFFLSGPNAVGQSAFRRGGYGAIAETVNQFTEMGDEAIDWAQSNKNIEMNQKAKLADMGAKPDVVKQTGSDVFSDLMTRENRPYLNHYTIDSLSYNSIAKLLERIGYQVNLYTSLNVMNRVGWNYVKLNSFELNPAYDMMTEQEDSIKKIFNQGVTLLHDKSYLTSGHNYETILDE